MNAGKKEWVVVEKSELGKNIYRLLLASENEFFLFFCSNLRQLRDLLKKKSKIKGFIVNANTFGESWKDSVAWFETDPQLQAQKIFVCGEKEENLQNLLVKLKNSVVLEKPFHPQAFLKTLKRLEAR